MEELLGVESGENSHNGKAYKGENMIDIDLIESVFDELMSKAHSFIEDDPDWESHAVDFLEGAGGEDAAKFFTRLAISHLELANPMGVAIGMLVAYSVGVEAARREAFAARFDESA